MFRQLRRFTIPNTGTRHGEYIPVRFLRGNKNELPGLRLGWGVASLKALLVVFFICLFNTNLFYFNYMIICLRQPTVSPVVLAPQAFEAFAIQSLCYYQPSVYSYKARTKGGCREPPMPVHLSRQCTRPVCASTLNLSHLSVAESACSKEVCLGEVHLIDLTLIWVS